MLTIAVRFRLVVCALACLVAAGCGSCSDAASTLGREATAAPPGPALVPSTKDDSRPKIVVLGDSLTAGLGLVETQSFPGLLQARIDADGFSFEIINGGVSGDTSAGGLRRLEWLLKDDVRVMVLALGANDGLRGLSVKEMTANLSTIVETAREKNVVVVLAGMEAPPNYGPEYSASFRQAFREIAAQYRLPFIPFLLANVAGQPALNQADGIHPNAEGAAIVADTVWATLKPILDQISSS
jgi:acyl-CoA thioesterase-1